MIYITSKEIEELDEEKLKAFLEKEYRENRFLDYKLKYENKSKDKEKEEFLADVTGFANLYGGNLIIGVKEKEEKDSGSLPGELVGIENGPEEAMSYRNLLDTSIDPQMHGYVVKEILLQNEKWAIVIYVPASLRRPHMVIFRGRNRFYIRHDDRTLKMTNDEIRRSVIEVVGLEKNIETYIQTIEEEIKEDFLQDDFSFMMHAAPYLLEEDQIDTSSQKIKSILQDVSLIKDLPSGFVPMPNLRGIFTRDVRENPSYYIYVYRTGYIGFVCNLKERFSHVETIEKFLAPWMRKYFLLFLKICKQVLEQAQISSPYQIRCNFGNCRGAVYRYKDQSNFDNQSDVVWKRDNLRLPGIRLDSFKDIEAVADILFERLRNAFGLPYP